MKSRLAKIVSGEYIKTPMLNFLAQAEDEQRRSIVNSIFRRSGIVSSYDLTGEYDSSLKIIAGENNTLIVQQGAFVSDSGKLIKVPRVETRISSQKETRIFIRFVQSIFIPDITISGNVGDLTISYSSDSILEYVEAGMGILTEKMLNRGELTALKIASVGNTLTVDAPLTEQITNERVIVAPKFITGVSTKDATCLYRFDEFEIIDESALPAQVKVPADAILLAEVVRSGDLYSINNIRATTEQEIDRELLHDSTLRYLPNVTSISTLFAETVQYAIKKLFTKGTMSLLDGEEKDIYWNSHTQNTDKGTSSPYFDISTGNGKFRIGDEGNSDYLIRLFTNADSKRSFELPSGVLTSSTKTTKLIASNISTQLAALYANQPVDVRLLSETVTFPSTSNIFNVSGGGVLKTISISGEGSSFVGQVLVCKFNSRTKVVSGGNIVSNYLPAVGTKDPDYIIEANEIVTFVNINFSYYIVSAGMSDYSRYLSLVSAVDALTTKVSKNKEISDTSLDTISKTVSRLAEKQITNSTAITNLESGMNTLSGVVTSHGDKITSLVTTVSDLNKKYTDIEKRLSDLEKAFSKLPILPVGAIVAFNLDDSKIAENFTTTGVGKEESPYKGWHICNGFDNTPNIQGRSLVMANSFTASNPAFPNGTGGGITWDSISPGERIGNKNNPTLSLGSGTQRMLGAFLSMLRVANLPRHSFIYHSICGYEDNWNTADFSASVQNAEGEGINFNPSRNKLSNVSVSKKVETDKGDTSYGVFKTDELGKNEPFMCLPPMYITIYLIKVS